MAWWRGRAVVGRIMELLDWSPTIAPNSTDSQRIQGRSRRTCFVLYAQHKAIVLTTLRRCVPHRYFDYMITATTLHHCCDGLFFRSPASSSQNAHSRVSRNESNPMGTFYKKQTCNTEYSTHTIHYKQGKLRTNQTALKVGLNTRLPHQVLRFESHKLSSLAILLLLLQASLPTRAIARSLTPTPPPEPST